MDKVKNTNSKEFKNIKNIVFDYDGTLHNSIKIYAPAFREAYNYLIESGQAPAKEFTDKEISKWLGFSSIDMWNSFMPNLKEDEKLKCSNIIGSNMIKHINENEAELYEGTVDVLNYLKNKGYNLIFLSNCKLEYMNRHKEIFGLDKYFTEFYCTEEFDFIPKYEIFKIIKEKYNGDFLIIGDRFVDIEISIIHNELSIGCNYGFGETNELKNANLIINYISELTTLL